MKNFRFLLQTATVMAALAAVWSCEKTEEPKDKEEQEQEQKPGNNNGDVNPEFTDNTYRIQDEVIAFESIAVSMVDDNICVAASPESGFTEVKDMMNSDCEYFYAAINPLLLGIEFNLKEEKSLFTFISTISGAKLQQVTSENNEEIKEGKCRITYAEDELNLSAVITLADDTTIELLIKTKAELSINQNIIGRGDERKVLRTVFYKEQNETTYLFMTPANISYFSELDIATWYMYVAVPSNLADGKEVNVSDLSTGDKFMFGIVDNVNADKNIEITDAGKINGFFAIRNDGKEAYQITVSFTADGIQYSARFNGNGISADKEAPVEVKEEFFKCDGTEQVIESAELIKGEETWRLALNLDNGKKAVVTMSESFWAKGGILGFSQDKNMSVAYDGTTYSKANGYSGTITVHLDEEAGTVEIEFTNYSGLEFYYKGGYTVRENVAPFKLRVYDVSAVTATVEVEPADAKSPYYMDIITASNYEQARIHGFDDYMSYVLENLEGQFGKSRKEIVEMITSYGNDGFIVTTLIPESRYYAFAVGINEEGMTTTEPVFQEFTTSEAETSANTLAITASDITSTTVKLMVEASTEDPYIFAVEPVSCLEGMSDEEIADYIIQSNIAWGGLDEITYSGSINTDYLGKAGWEYAAVAFGYENGSVTTDVSKTIFRLDDSGAPEDCTFAFGQEFEGWEMRVSITPSDDSVVYICNYIKKSDLDALTVATGNVQSAFKECLETLIEDMIADLGTRARVVDLISTMGAQEFTTKFEYSTEYIQWAVPVDQDGRPTAGFSFSEIFTSPEEKFSDATLTLKSYRVFNGDDLAALYSEFKSAKGYAVVELVVEPSPEAVEWRSYIAMEDISDRSREVVIKNLEIAPTQNNLTVQYITAFWGTNTIMGVAKDAAGDYGDLLLEVINIDKHNVVPAELL